MTQRETSLPSKLSKRQERSGKWTLQTTAVALYSSKKCLNKYCTLFEALSPAYFQDHIFAPSVTLTQSVLQLETTRLRWHSREITLVPSDVKADHLVTSWKGKIDACWICFFYSLPLWITVIIFVRTTYFNIQNSNHVCTVLRTVLTAKGDYFPKQH
jgi:hypothetical protein